ncbi:MAG: hypothetical protein EXX96DRAFT_262255 [Benjaminiella poitrasii]|nr:MAG: hypothetical protein EXX96DRAFT_262255 [Benjaminiella poitrasii]
MKMQYVALRLDGSAFTWFTALPQPTQKSWKEFSTDFLRKYASGLTSSEAALKTLKDLQKGDKPMHDFCTELASLLHRANVFVFNLQMDYLMEKLLPRLAKAFASHNLNDLEEALRVCTRLEHRLQQIDQLQNKNKRTSTFNPINTVSTTTENVYQEQNYQRHHQGKRYVDKKSSCNRNSSNHHKETRTCYRCKKTGHSKKNCRVRIEQKQNIQQEQQQTQQADDINIFAQFLQNSQTTYRRIQQEDSTRFTITAMETQ